jgi:hypothetical protein
VSPIVGLIIFATIVCLAMLGAAVVSSWNSGTIRIRKELKTERQKTGRYEHALRAIANGAGNPSLEAQIVLDKQNELES